MRDFINTNKKLELIGSKLVNDLREELKFQKHNATGELSRGIKTKITKTKESILNITSTVKYWKAVNNPALAKIPNLKTIYNWMQTRSIEGGFPVANLILKRLQQSGYGNRNYPDNSMRDPYIVYKKGNQTPRRTNFAGYVVDKLRKTIGQDLAHDIGKDVASIISKQVK